VKHPARYTPRPKKGKEKIRKGFCFLLWRFAYLASRDKSGSNKIQHRRYMADDILVGFIGQFDMQILKVIRMKIGRPCTIYDVCNILK